MTDETTEAPDYSRVDHKMLREIVAHTTGICRAVGDFRIHDALFTGIATLIGEIEEQAKVECGPDGSMNTPAEAEAWRRRIEKMRYVLDEVRTQRGTAQMLMRKRGDALVSYVGRTPDARPLADPLAERLAALL